MRYFEDLRDYLKTLEEKGMLQTIRGADWRLEIGAISALVANSDAPRALLFDDVKDYAEGYRVATDLYVSDALQALALDLPTDGPRVQLVREWRERLRAKPIPPREVSDGPLLENEMSGEDVDLTKLPIPVWHERYAARYLAGGAVILKDPDTGWVNVGVYRCMVDDRKTLGLMVSPGHHGLDIIMKYWGRGKAAPVVVVGAQDPLLFYAAAAPVPYGISEIDFAGGLRGSPYEVIVDEDGLPIPKFSEVAVIGEIPPGILEQEGPFGDCAGYYARKGPTPIIRVKKVMFRDEPIIQGNPPFPEDNRYLKGSSNSFSLGSQLGMSAMYWDALENLGLDVAGVYSIYQPCATPTVLVVSLRNPRPGQAMRAAAASLGVEGMMKRAVVVVDEDVDPSDIYQVLFAVTTRCDFARDAQVVKGLPTSELDPVVDSSSRERGELTSSCVIIDATRKGKDFPPTSKMSEELKRAVMAKWGQIISGFEAGSTRGG